MLPKEKRVDKKTFEILIKDGKILFSSLFSFRYTEQENPRYAFVAPKKIFKTAVLRNKYKRIGFNFLKNIKPLKNIGLFVYKKEALVAEKEQIEKEIESILKKSKSI